MKNVLIVLGVLCLQVIFGLVTEESVPPAYKKCLEEINMTMEKFLSIMNKDFIVTEGIPKYNDVVLCAYRKDNYVKADDTLDNVNFQNLLVNVIMKYANVNVDNPEKVAASATEACKTVQGSDPGDTLVKHYNCIIKYLNKL